MSKEKKNSQFSKSLNNNNDHNNNIDKESFHDISETMDDKSILSSLSNVLQTQESMG